VSNNGALLDVMHNEFLVTYLPFARHKDAEPRLRTHRATREVTAVRLWPGPRVEQKRNGDVATAKKVSEGRGARVPLSP